MVVVKGRHHAIAYSEPMKEAIAFPKQSHQFNMTGSYKSLEMLWKIIYKSKSAVPYFRTREIITKAKINQSTF